MGYDLYCADGEHDGGSRSFACGTMSRLAQIMDSLGMLDHAAEPVDWQCPDNGGALTDDDWWALFDAHRKPDTPLSPAAAEYQRQLRRFTDAQAPTPLGIPLHKLRTNDGWLVTPAEIRAALTFYAAPVAHFWPPFSESDARMWGGWIAWLELCAARGGFRVY